MAEKRMLIIDAEVARKIDENRGEMSQTDFLNFLIDSHLKEEVGKQAYVNREEFHQFGEGIKELLRHFLEFFLSYGLELGRQPQDKTFAELKQKLTALDSAADQAKKL